jgi:hypothetical protein
MSAMTQSDLFEMLGATLCNQRWSWGAVRPDGVVFLRVWQDRTRRIDKTTYTQITHRDKYEDKKTDPGYQERLQHVELVKQGATCYMIMCEVEDPTAIPRKVKDFNEDDVFLGGQTIEIDGDSWIELGPRTKVFALVRAYKSITV